MKSFGKFLEDIGNTAGSGAIAGIGVGPQGEPGVDVSDDKELSSSSRAAKNPIWPMMKRKKPSLEETESADTNIKLNANEWNMLDYFATETVYTKGYQAGKVKYRDPADHIKAKVLGALWDKKLIDFKVNTVNGNGYACTPLGFQVWLNRKKKPVNEDLFAGAEVFDVPTDVFHKCRLGKLRYHRWSKYVGDDAIGQKIRAYGIANPNKSIVIRDNRTGAMMFLRHIHIPTFAGICR